MAVCTKKNHDSKFSHDVNRYISKGEFCNSWCCIFTKRSVILNPDMKLKKEKSIHQADWEEEQGHHEETLPSGSKPPQLYNGAYFCHKITNRVTQNAV